MESQVEHRDHFNLLLATEELGRDLDMREEVQEGCRLGGKGGGGGCEGER